MSAPATHPEATVGTEVVASVTDLSVAFPAGADWRTVVRGVSLTVRRGDRIAIVGESGSGKTMVGMSLLGISPEQARVRGQVLVDGIDPQRGSPAQLRRLRGDAAAMVFQDPLTSLNPVRTIGAQLTESVRRHQRLGRAQARVRVLEALHAVGVPAPAERLGVYPHQLSGGLRQRVMIAMAILNRPALLVADEPTTALDATIQAQILGVLRSGLDAGALLLITHDLAVAAEVCTSVVVMYAGQIVEQGPIAELLRRPRHPYTRGLIAAVPTFDPARPSLRPIPGTPPTRPDLGVGCRFADRCAYVSQQCRDTEPALADGVACWHPREEALR
ncbi:ABC transporter ATP-binding protein [Micromonospora sp. NPDC047074]|uniref:ABC transporter ATP-binding protein n=1 Tax=Micromonospora sp. NPDC047074 TaxID=3154339 RepID=UPI0033F5FA03